MDKKGGMRKMTDTQIKKQISLTALLFSVTYMVSYMTRINFGAVISEMESATGFQRQLLSMAVTGSFVTYGIGQIVSGIFGDRIQPKRLVAAGLLVTALMNALIPLCTDPTQMLICWCMNGFAQAFMWPPLVRMMSAQPAPADYNKMTVQVNRGGSLGTIAVYLLAPLVIAFANWRWVFFLCAAAAVAMLFVWLRCAKPVPVQPVTEEGSVRKALFSPVMLLVMVAIMLMGMLRDGVTTWMPTYIAEKYDLGNAVSILTGVLMPVFSMITYQFTGWLHAGKIKNPLTCAGVMFAVGALSALLLRIGSDQSPVLGVLFSALLTGCMHGVNLLLVCVLPSLFKRWGSTAFASGVLNACTYVGSAVATYGIAALSKGIGWGVTVVLWAVAATVGGGICVFCAKGFKKRFF